MSNRQNIQPVEGSLTGTDLTATINDRIRRINQALGAAPAPTVIVSSPSTGGGGNWVFQEVPAGLKNNINSTYTLVNAPNPPLSLALYLNGVFQEGSGIDYTLTGLTIVYNHPLVIADLHMANYEF